MKQAIAIIPARFASSRFPGKPLALINGKSMIMRVYEQALKAELLKDVYVATDDKRVFDHVIQSGAKALMTSVHHSSGTERCLEAYEKLLASSHCSSEEIILNIQGDEPFIQPEQIDALIKMFANPDIRIATLMKSISDTDEIANPGCVKVVCNQHGQALYFSRAPIPFNREGSTVEETPKDLHYKHIGMYAYRSYALAEICKLPPSRLESIEKLEQLRWLEHGFPIHVEVTEFESIAIDYPDDLLKVTNTA